MVHLQISTMNNGFLTVSNLIECINVFTDYMSKTYSITVFDVTDEQELKEIFYSEMKIVSNNPVYTNYTLKDKNNHVMNIIKNKILNLSRQMYIPDITERIQSKKDDDIKREYDTLLKSRNDENQTENNPYQRN